MDYIRLGRTGLKVSRICLGCMTYGTPKWRDWVLDEEASRPFIRRALELGINFFDTADMYSLGASEEILGRALKEFAPRRDEIVVATKVYFPMGADRHRSHRRGLQDEAPGGRRGRHRHPPRRGGTAVPRRALPPPSRSRT